MHDIPPGTVFARDFRVVRRLAEGGMGMVYVAEQLSTGKARALKVMQPGLAGDARSAQRFAEEARLAASIDSDHVVEVIAAGVDEGTQMPWIAMELLQGEDLGAALARRGPFPLSDALAILEQLGHALDAAHRMQLVHRDLKPENVFLAEARRPGVPFTVKILDFGIAKVVDQARATETAPIGSPHFMAPEQTESRGAISPRTDVWALGLIAYKLLTGRHYWHGASRAGVSVSALLREMLIEPLVPASHRAASQSVAALLPAWFDGWFARTVAREPSDRFPNAGEALAALRAAAGAPRDPAVLAPSASAPTKAAAAAPGPPPIQAPTWFHRIPVGAGRTPVPAAPPDRQIIALGAAAVALVLAVLAGAAIFAFVLFRSRASADETVVATGPPPSHAAAALPVTADDPVLGRHDAPVTIVEFMDFECPFCRKSEPVMEQLQARYGEQLRIVPRALPLAFHPRARPAHVAAFAVHALGGDRAYFAFHRAALARSPTLDDAGLESFATGAGVSLDAFRRELVVPRHGARIDADLALASRLGVRGTPTFFVNGTRLDGARTFEAFRDLVDAELVRARDLVATGVEPAEVYPVLSARALAASASQPIAAAPAPAPVAAPPIAVTLPQAPPSELLPIPAPIAPREPERCREGATRRCACGDGTFGQATCFGGKFSSCALCD